MDSEERLMADAAASLNARRIAPEIEVLVDTRWRGRWRVQGLCAFNLWTDVFEPVRIRRPFTTRWKAVQPVHEAARLIEWFLTHRPDLPADDRPTNGSLE